MTMQELEARLKALEDEITCLKDVEEIKKLTRIYGYYLEHWQWPEIVELFSDSHDTSVEISNSGVYLGKEGVKRFFYREKVPKDFLHVMMQISGVVNVDPDGKTAQGRWYGFGAIAMPVETGVYPGFMNGVYENEYVKEDGKWKFKHIRWCLTFAAGYKDGWVDPSRRVDTYVLDQGRDDLAPDGPHEETEYPSGFICPFHYKHPVTGK